MFQFLIFIVHFMCLMELPIPTSPVDQSLLTQFHMERMGCFTIEQLYQWRPVTVYYRHFPPDRLKSRSYQINSGWWRSEYWLSNTFKRLKLFQINSKDMIKNVGIKLFILFKRTQGTCTPSIYIYFTKTTN